MRYNFLSKPIQGDSDWRNYRALRLANKIPVLLVQDAVSKTTAIAVSVSAGASSDPRSLPGLAHFTEHMCFLGSERYPGENQYKAFLSQHGGRSNASTSMSSTTFQFAIPFEYFEPAVDIFSAFFTCPLFTESGTAREVQAVDSENSKNKSTDPRRRLQILKALADPHHHYSKFSTGNKQTLYDNHSEDPTGTGITETITTDPNRNPSDPTSYVRQALLAFHRYHYTPENMVIVCIGPQSLDTLENLIVPRFEILGSKSTSSSSSSTMISSVSSQDPPFLQKVDVETLIREAAQEAPPDMFYKQHMIHMNMGHEDTMPSDADIRACKAKEPVPYNPAFKPQVQNHQWPVVLTIPPLKSVRQLYLYFPMPPPTPYPTDNSTDSSSIFADSSPLPILSHLLGHEGTGSCFAALQNSNFITGISAGPRLLDSDQTLFQVSITLTELGEEKWEQVVQIIFQYCRLIERTTKDAIHGDITSLDQLKDVWWELQTLRRLNFHQTLPGDAYTTAPDLANAVRRYGMEECLSKGSMLNETRDTLPLNELNRFISLITPGNCIIERSSQSAWNELMKDKNDENYSKSDEERGSKQSIFGFKTEKWYDIEYHLSKVSNATVNIWNEPSVVLNYPLHLPKRNEYIPDDLSLCSELPAEALKGPRIEKELEPPKLLVNTSFGRLWHRLDDRYCQPKASCSILIRTPQVESIWNSDSNAWEFDTETSMMSALLMNIFSEGLAQSTYDAKLAGLNWNLSKSSKGILLHCSGYSQHLTSFTENILKQFFRSQTLGDETFLVNQYFSTSKESMMRHLQSYLQSQRADTYAAYYTELLTSSQSKGIMHTIEITKDISLDALKKHHCNLLQCGRFQVDCLISGNVSGNNARTLFSTVEDTLQNALKSNWNSARSNHLNSNAFKWVPGPIQKRPREGEDIHLHFQSENDQEENGAVTMTFFSPFSSFKGKQMSTNESLINSASIRVLCHMLREPLFNQLRTKEQLGYIVNSYYNIAFSTQNNIDMEMQETINFSTTAIDSIVINILSKKAPPPVISKRVDEFLESFRAQLTVMKDDEIKSHTSALSKKMLEPKKKLSDEVQMHFSKISMFAPECLASQLTDGTKSHDEKIPWNSSKELAAAVDSIDRDKLLKTWDSLITNRKRSRIVSHIYGNTFPLNIKSDLYGSATDRVVFHIDSIDELKAKRETLRNISSLEKQIASQKSLNWRSNSMSMIPSKSMIATGILGASLLAFAFGAFTRRNDKKGSK